MKYLNTYNENVDNGVIVITDIPVIALPTIVELVNEKYDVDFPDNNNWKHDIWMMISLTDKEMKLDDNQSRHHCWCYMTDINEFVLKYKDYYITCKDWLKQEFNIDLSYLIEGDKMGLI